MAVKKIPVPFCDVCGEPWLPKHRLDDGTLNPIFEHPDRAKRCGKCKSTCWNAAGIDRRRKPNVESPAEVSQVTVEDVEQTVDRPILPSRAIDARCKHGLYNCPECHPPEAA